MKKSKACIVAALAAVLTVWVGVPVHAQGGMADARAATQHAILQSGGPPPAPESVLYNFINSSEDGHYPEGSLISDAAGNLYGTDVRGGTTAGGTVFELSPQSGGWTYTELHAFHSSKEDGRNPNSGVTFDKAGNLYGSTSEGGLYGYGTIFELSPVAGGGWTEQVIHNFKGSGSTQEGSGPLGPLVFDTAGNLYGTTYSGGATTNCSNFDGCGVVYELSPLKTGGWTERVLYSFLGEPDGANPESGVVFDAVGNLYGTTVGGGSGNCGIDVNPGCGTVFELQPGSDGGWAEGLLHTFKNSSTDGYYPAGGLVLDADGNLYGTTVAGGDHTCTYSCGTVFELSLKPGGGWSKKILYNFQENGTDGFIPFAGLIFDAAGRLYGTTDYGGKHDDGTVFRLSPKSGGTWSERVLHSFAYGTTDGRYPMNNGNLLIDSSGNLYGMTSLGGATGGGIVFEVVQ